MHLDTRQCGARETGTRIVVFLDPESERKYWKRMEAARHTTTRNEYRANLVFINFGSNEVV